MNTFPDGSLSGADLMRQFLPTSPYIGHLGMQLRLMEPDVVELVLPFADALVTTGTIVHGGAIASVIDTAAAAAAWSNTDIPEKIRGVCKYDN